MRQITTRVNAMTASIALRPTDEIRSETTTVAGSTFSSDIIQSVDNSSAATSPLLLPRVVKVQNLQVPVQEAAHEKISASDLFGPWE